MTTRDDIPAETKRAVRQRCGFGCVLCGNPLFHYDHIEEYSVTKEHTEDNITLLCADHRDRKTRGLLDVPRARNANAMPFCIANGGTTPFNLGLTGPECHVILGTNRSSTAGSGRFPAITVDGHDLFALTIDPDGRVLLDMELLDTQGNLLFQVVENEILVQSQNVWDIEFVGKRGEPKGRLQGGGVLTVRHALRNVALEMEFRRIVDPDLINVRITKADLHCPGAHVVATSHCMGIGGQKTALFGIGQFATAGGLSIATPTVPGAAFAIRDVVRCDAMSEGKRNENMAAIQEMLPPKDIDGNAGRCGYYVSTCPVNLHVISVE